jgi:Leucine-rich repeat (LRR) protein
VTCSGDHIKEITLPNNNLTGIIPGSIGTFSNLQVLNLGANQLSGTIPLEIGNLTNLLRLHLHLNQLSGPIPSELGNLSSLQRLWLEGNQLSSSLPPELGNLINLVQLYLHYNQLSGSIPSTFGNLSNLKELFAYGNQLTGPIPPEIGNCINLTHLYLNSNQINGSIPPEIGNLSNLRKLNLGINELGGNIPPQIGNLTALRELFLHNNPLTGNIPDQVGNLTNLVHLYLYNTTISGNIPSSIGNCINLTELLLFNNSLGGKIPSELGVLGNLRLLSQGSYKFIGRIPNTLLLLTNLMDNRSNIRYNALYTHNDFLRTFLNNKQSGGEWENTQTVTPYNLAVTGVSDNSITLSWTAIDYQTGGGGYEIWVTDDPANWSPNPCGMTADKTVESFTVDGLAPHTIYYMKLRTVTDPTATNKNIVVSEFTHVIFTTTTGELKGCGTAVIDAVLSPGEWERAERIDLTLNTPHQGTCDGTIFIMNDDDTLYVALLANYIEVGNTVSISFDSDKDQVLGTGDDRILYNPDIGFLDEAWTTASPCAGICPLPDTDQGGSQDGEAAFSQAGGFTVYEFSHPLSSADTALDFQASFGDLLPFNLFVRFAAVGGIWPDDFGNTSYPALSHSDAINYGLFEIAHCSPVFTHLSFLLDSPEGLNLSFSTPSGSEFNTAVIPISKQGSKDSAIPAAYLGPYKGDELWLLFLPVNDADGFVSIDLSNMFSPPKETHLMFAPMLRSTSDYKTFSFVPYTIKEFFDPYAITLDINGQSVTITPRFDENEVSLSRV